MKAELRRKLNRWHRFMEYERYARGVVATMDDFIAKSEQIGADTTTYVAERDKCKRFLKLWAKAPVERYVREPLSVWRRLGGYRKGKLTFEEFRGTFSANVVAFSLLSFLGVTE